MKPAILMLLLCLPVSNGVAAETMYVQAQKAGVLAEAKSGAVVVTELARGASVSVLEKSGLWYKVQVENKQGFISRLFLSPNKPVGAAELAKANEVSLEKANRRRSSSFAATASTRGLQADERVRQGREMYQADFRALQKVEKYEIPADRLQLFRKQAGLE